MNHACIVKLKDTDRYVGRNMADVERARAPIEPRAAAVNRARKRFGKDWPFHAEIIEVSRAEFMRQIAAKGGKKVTPKKLEWLTRGRMDAMPVLFYRGEMNGDTLCLAARTIGQAAEMLERMGYGKELYWKVYRSFKPGRYGLGKNDTRTTGIAWKKLNGEWRKIL